MIKQLRKEDALFLAISIVVFVVFQFLMSERILSSFWRLNITVICLNIILASSLNLINGITGQFSLGHAGLMAIGAYVSAVFTIFLHTPFIISLIAGAGAAGILGFLIGVPTLRLEGDYLAIATLGMGEIIRICILNIPQVGGASGLSGIPNETTFPWLFFSMIITLFVIKNILHSNKGRACLAVRENSIAAEAMGINITKTKVFAFTIASIFAGLAGALFSHYFGIAHPSSFTFMRSFDIMTMVVLGGLGSISGSIVGAVILTFITAAMQSYPEYRMIVYALLLIVLMLSGRMVYLVVMKLQLSFLRNGIKEVKKMAQLLKTNNVSKFFGGIKAVQNFDIYLNEGEMVGLIGPNGAGKTTAFNLLTGVYQPTTGSILLDGLNLVGMKPHMITQHGVARTFQNIRLFDNLSVLDNVKIAFNYRIKYNLAETILRIGRYGKEERQVEEEALDILKIFNLEDKKDELAKNLPYGKQRHLEIARALAAKPKLLLLDEPAAGMNPQETQDLMKMIEWIREKFHLTILLIEHDMALVMGICERIYVLEFGKILAEGIPDEIKSNAEVIKAYLEEEV